MRAPTSSSDPDSPIEFENPEAVEASRQELAERLGRVIKHLRTEQGWTLTEVARRSGLSQPYLSQLENGKAMIGLLALHRVAHALDTTVLNLLDNRGPIDVSIVRTVDAEIFQLTPTATMKFMAEGIGHVMEPNLVHAEPASEWVTSTEHPGEEFVFVIGGEVEIGLEGHLPVTLKPGDLFYYPATRPHRWRVVGPVPADFMMVSSPPTF